MRSFLLASCAVPLACIAGGAAAQTLQDREVAPPTVAEAPAPASDDQVRFTADQLEYDLEGDVVVASGEVRMSRQGERLRADKVTWDRKTGKVVATGNIAVTNPDGDIAYGDQIELTDSLKDGLVENMLVVLNQGGRIAADRGTRAENGTVSLLQAAYTPCAVVDTDGCPKEPSWKITAVRVTYRPDRKRVYYDGARFNLFGLPSLPLPRLSHPVGGGSDSGLLSPSFRIGRVNGLEAAVPYYWAIGENRGLTVTPHVFTSVMPMLEANYRQLDTTGAFSITGYATASRRSDDVNSGVTDTTQAFRGYIDGIGRFQLSPEWSLSTSLRLVTDRTFLRRYDISSDDRIRSTVALERVDADSYFSLAGWAVQTLRQNDRQGLQPVALPEFDYRRIFRNIALGGNLQVQANTLAISRHAGQDTQRAFAAAKYDVSALTRWGQEVTLTAYARADAYNTNDPLATDTPSYRGLDGFRSRAIGALAVDVRWPLIGEAFGGVQRLTPRFQIVASPRIENLDIPNEDARAVDLEDSNLFALNRFAGYDRFEDSSRATYGAEWNLDLPGLAISTIVGQSYRLNERPSILPDGTGLSDRFSDIVGRTQVRYRDFVAFTYRYRFDKDSMAVRRSEVDATVGSRTTYALAGYLRLNRNIKRLEDLRDREEIRLAGRVQLARFWSVFGSTIIDLTDNSEDIFSIADGFDPLRHRVGVEYEDDCLRLGLAWKREYTSLGDARRGDSFLLTLALTNLGR
jgi:LPS-assembly protein